MEDAIHRLEKARALLANETPLRIDCGRLCDGACCLPDESGENGMLLYPFEETLYEKPIEGFSFRLVDDASLVRSGKRLVCDGECPRDKRPLACRVFPLRMKAVRDEHGVHAEAQLDPRARAICPLPTEGGLRAMRPSFTEAVRKAGDELCGHPALLAALENEQKLIDDWLRF